MFVFLSRELEEKHIQAQSRWNQWKKATNKSLKRIMENIKELISYLELWRYDIHSIEDPECTVYAISNTKGLVYFYSYIIDLLSGTGFLEMTSLFYGYYSVDNVPLGLLEYHVPLAYLLITLAYLLVSFVWIIKRSVEGFKRSLIYNEDPFQSYCNKILAGWDFCITDVNAARLKHSSLLYELRADLQDERSRQRAAGRSLKEKMRIYSLRIFLNCVVLAVLAACFYSIYRVTVYSQEYAFPCWESRVGQEMYKLMIFDLIIICAIIVFIDFPRK
ncbi:hypothetical protein Chor_015209 [Crotalus horridus]